jgi:hypothetical protein
MNVNLTCTLTLAVSASVMLAQVPAEQLSIEFFTSLAPIRRRGIKKWRP